VFKEWKTFFENQTGKKIKRLITDNGLEFYNHQFDEFCKAKRIVRHKTMVNTPQ
jgi:transposase InsO family protein